MLEVIVEFLGHLIFERLLYGTGWVVLFVATLGRARVSAFDEVSTPRGWMLWTRELGMRTLTTNAVMLVGAVTWTVAIATALLLLLRR